MNTEDEEKQRDRGRSTKERNGEGEVRWGVVRLGGKTEDVCEITERKKVKGFGMMSSVLKRCFGGRADQQEGYCLCVVRRWDSVLSIFVLFILKRIFFLSFHYSEI